MIRSMLPTDALALGLSRSRNGRQPLTAPTWPRTPPESERPNIFTLLQHALIPRPGGGQIGVSRSDGQVIGYILLRPRAAGLVWDIAHLTAVDEMNAVELVRWAQERVLGHRGRRIMIDTPDAGPGPDVARQAGFEQYTEGVTCGLDRGFSRTYPDVLPARPRLRADEVGLFQLYSAAVPASVRAAEAMTQEEWAALFPGRKLWAPAILSNSQDYVWEMGSRIIGWTRVTYGARSQSMELMIHPNYETYADRIVRYALTQMSVKVPVLSDVREYQGAVRTALERVGFRPGPRYQAWCLALAARIPEPSMAGLQAPVSPG
jgi:hypothetical protein